MNKPKKRDQKKTATKKINRKKVSRFVYCVFSRHALSPGKKEALLSRTPHQLNSVPRLIDHQVNIPARIRS